MTRVVSVSVTQPASRGLMLPCVLVVVGTLREVAHQVQSPENPVAQQKRADEQHGQMLDVRRFHPWTPSPALGTGDGGSLSGSPFRSNVRSKISSVVVVAVMVLVNDGMPLATGD